MKSIINAKNALALLFLIPILTSAISIAMPHEVDYKIPTVIKLVSYLIIGLSSLYLACTKNEFITNRKQKIGLYIISFYYVIYEALITRLSYLISKGDIIYNFISKICTDETMQIKYTILTSTFFALICIIAFLMFFWGIPTKKSTKWLLSILFLIPIITTNITPFFIENMEFNKILNKTIDIACSGLMLFLVTKAYKTKINID